MKIMTKTIHTVSWKDLEEEAKLRYRLEDYSFVDVEEGGNDSSYLFDVDGSCDEEDIAADIRAGKEVKTYRNGELLNVLCADGFIPAGDYLITVCW